MSCSDSPTLLIFLNKPVVSQDETAFLSVPSNAKLPYYFPYLQSPVLHRHGVSLMLWLPSVSAELGYGCTGERGEMGLAPGVQLCSKVLCCVPAAAPCQVGTCLASQRKQRPNPPQVPWVYPRISWALIFPTSHAHPRLLCPPWPPSQPFLRSLCPYFPFCFLE